MDWQQIVVKLRLLKEYFDRSYKCLNTDRPTKDETVDKHVSVLFDSFEQIRVLINVNYPQLTPSHKAAAEGFFADVRGKLANVLSRRGLDVKLPDTLHEKLVYKTEGQGIEGLDLPQAETENSLEASTMTQSVTQFLGLASKLLPDFDGRPENLQSFVDAIGIVDSIKETHEVLAVNLVKTKLKGTARNLINSETTLAEIVSKLKGSVKGESVSVLSAKLMNIRQSGKNANAYVKEVEDLTKALESAYISDGLPAEVAGKYSTQQAVRAVAKNANNERVKLIIESGQFANMNELVSKFISSCTEASSQPNSVMFYGSNRRSNNRYRGNGRGNGRGRSNGSNDNRRYNNNNGNRNGGGSNNRNRGRNNNSNNTWSGNRNIRLVTEDSSGNGQHPLNVQ